MRSTVTTRMNTSVKRDEHDHLARNQDMENTAKTLRTKKKNMMKIGKRRSKGQLVSILVTRVLNGSYICVTDQRSIHPYYFAVSCAYLTLYRVLRKCVHANAQQRNRNTMTCIVMMQRYDNKINCLDFTVCCNETERSLNGQNSSLVWSFIQCVLRFGWFCLFKYKSNDEILYPNF